jgi:membrane protein required for colicin V production
MHAFDIIFGLIAAIFVIVGIRRGFIDEVMRLVAVVAGFICGLLFYRQLAPKLDFLALSPNVTGVIAFLAVFFACVIAIFLVGKIIKKVVTLTMLGWLDRLCGGAVGAVKAFFFGWVFVIAVSALPGASAAPFFRDSPVFSFFVAISPTLKTQVLRGAKMHALGKNAATHPSSFSFGDLWLKFRSMGQAKDSVNGKEPARVKHPPAHKDVL